MKTTSDRFWEKVRKAGPEDCWMWLASGTTLGYGSFRWNGATTTAHRVAYMLNVGPIPAGLQVDHLCNTRRCVNPSHLRTVTNIENINALHSQAAARLFREKTHCKRGHPFTNDNTYVEKVAYKNGSVGKNRHCKTCERVRHRAAYWGEEAEP